MEKNRKLWIIAVMLAFCITACTKGELTEGGDGINSEVNRSKAASLELKN